MKRVPITLRGAESLRAELAEQTTRAERAEVERDAEIARLRAEVERLTVMVRERDVALVEGIAGWLPKADADRLKADLAAHKRALAAGPAALRGSIYDGVAKMVLAAQEAAMKEKP